MQYKKTNAFVEISRKCITVHCSMNKAQKLSQQISVRVSQDMYDAIADIAVFEKRKPNEVARLLLERGLADYISDRELFLDTPVDYSSFKEEKRIEITIRRANE